jgi:ribosomal protein S18 acetylase RimI-like enzyme
LTKHPLPAKNIVRLLKIRTIIGAVGTISGHIVCYAIYHILDDRIAIYRLGVRPDVQRRGYGSAVIEGLKQKLNKDRCMLSVEIPESRLDMLNFFKNRDFLATRVVRDGCPFGEDTIIMEYKE